MPWRVAFIVAAADAAAVGDADLQRLDTLRRYYEAAAPVVSDSTLTVRTDLGWQGWPPVLTGTFEPGDPSRCSQRPPGSIDLFAVGQDGRVWTSWFHPPQGWQGWQHGPGPAVRPADAQSPWSATCPARIDLFAVGQDGHVWTAWFHPPQGWQGWQPSPRRNVRPADARHRGQRPTRLHRPVRGRAGRPGLDRVVPPTAGMARLAARAGRHVRPADTRGRGQRNRPHRPVRRRADGTPRPPGSAHHRAGKAGTGPERRLRARGRRSPPSATSQGRSTCSRSARTAGSGPPGSTRRSPGKAGTGAGRDVRPADAGRGRPYPTRPGRPVRRRAGRPVWTAWFAPPLFSPPATPRWQGWSPIGDEHFTAAAGVAAVSSRLGQIDLFAVGRARTGQNGVVPAA